jgi:amino acid adenylation domain-containing protein
MTREGVAANLRSVACIHELIEAQVRRAPYAVAVRVGDRAITYAALDDMANRCARVLRARGVGAETLVGLCGARSPELVAGLLGILKAGGAYVPLDTSFPIARIEHMLSTADVTLVLCADSSASMPWLAGRDCVELQEASRAAGYDDDSLSRAAVENVAAVMFTSGSAGRPKGVVLPHRAIVSRLAGRRYDVADVICQKASLTSVAHISDLLLPLVSGATVQIFDEAVIADPVEFARRIQQHGITRFMALPWQLQALLGCDEAVSSLSGVKLIVISGEPVPHALVDIAAVRLPETTLMNSYGMSETAGMLTRSILKADDGVRIGHPMPGVRLYVVDEKLSQAPVGDIGEIWAGGPQLARGYLRHPALTATHFVPDPFSDRGERIYRTGDVGALTADGSIELFGRRDHQVKVGGRRVNLLEVESAMEAEASVAQAVVVGEHGAEGEPGTLHAFIVLRDGWQTASTIEALRSQMTAMLPRFMVPTTFTMVDRLPVLPNGKIDRPRLTARANQTNVGAE